MAYLCQVVSVVLNGWQNLSNSSFHQNTPHQSATFPGLVERLKSFNDNLVFMYSILEIEKPITDLVDFLVQSSSFLNYLRINRSRLLSGHP